MPNIEDWLLSDWPFDKLEPTGTPQLYRVSAGTTPLIRLAGFTTNCIPLQTTVLIALMTGLGSIVIATVKAAPLQVPTLGITR